MATPASCPDYEAPFAFTGHIDKVSVTVGEQGTLDKARILEAALAEQVAAHTVGGGDLRVTSPQRKTHQGRRRRPRPRPWSSTPTDSYTPNRGSSPTPARTWAGNYGAGCPKTPSLPNCPLSPSSGGVLRCPQR